MKKTIFFILCFVLMFQLVSAMPNPSAVFCEEEGHEYITQKESDGSEVGYCQTNKDSIEGWDYYNNNKEEISRIKTVSNDSALKESKLKKAIDNSFISKKLKNTASEDEIKKSGIIKSAPSSFDWRSYNSADWTTSVKNQGSCGACWAFSSVAVVETKANINLNDATYNPDISEQDVISNNNGDSSCDGGSETDAFNYMKNPGVTRETCMPYTQSNTGTMCANGANEKLKISNYVKVSASANAIKDAIASQGPVVAYMVVCDDFNSFSGSGIYSHSGDVFYDDSCWWTDGEYDYLNWHSVTITGYNDASQYWIVKNSWGTGWGDNGYIKISYDQTITNYANWIDAVLNDDDGDERVFFIDDSYYVTGTDVTTNPSISSFTSPTSYNKSDVSILFSANAEPKSLKYLSSVKINDISMNGNLQTGGEFTLTKSGSDFGCTGETTCALTLTATDDAGKTATSNIDILIDDLAPRVTNFQINNESYYVRGSENLIFQVNVEDADISSVKINDESMSGSGNDYSLTTKPSELGCISDDVCTFNITATDYLGNINNSVYKNLFIDDEPPTINYVNLSDYILQSGTYVDVSVNATDNINISSVTAEGISLEQVEENKDLWIGNIPLTTSPLNIIAVDMAGNNVSNNSVEYEIDDVPPGIYNVQITPDFATVGNLINISFSLIEENLRNMSVKLNDYNATLNYSSEGYYEFHYNVSGVEEEGNVVVNISIIDEADNLENHIQNITFDLVPPNITFIYVERNIAKTNSSLFVSMNITEGNIDFAQVNNQSIECHGSDLEKICNGTIIINSTNVKFEIWDLAGNYDYNETSIILDDELPTINSINLSNNLTQSGTRVLLTINATDNIDIANITAGNELLNKDGDIWTLDIQLYGSPLNIVVTDNATNVLGENLTFTIDDLLPVINGSISHNSEILDSGLWYNHSLHINLTAEDINGIKNIEWRYANETSWYNYSSSFEITENIPQNRILYRATDNAENFALSKRLNIKIDKNAPIINEIKLNSNKTIPSESLLLFIKTSDSLSGIKDITATINDTIYSDFELVNGYYRTEIFAPNTTGVYEINVSIQDFAGNINESDIKLEISYEEPVIIPSLNKGNYVKNSTIIYFKLFNVINGTYNTSLITNKNLTNAEEVSITIKNESFFEIYFNVTNDGTNYSLFYFNYSIDLTNPNLIINNLESSNVLNGSFDIDFECSDLKMGVKNIKILMNNNQIANLSNNADNYVLDTFLFNDSSHNLTFVCYDFADNKNITELNISINNSALITQVNNNGVVLFEDTPINNYIEMITGINSTNLTMLMQVLKSPNITLPNTLKKELLYLNIHASNKAESKVYFNLPMSILENVEISNLKMWVDHNESGTFEGPYQIYEVENDDEKYKFYFITDSYSEFVIAEEHDVCGEGLITSSCICGNNVYGSGYCCSNVYKSTTCNSDTGSPSGGGSPSSGGSPSGGGISMPPIKDVIIKMIENVSFEVLKEGYESWMYVNEGIFFVFEKQNHTLIINEISEFNATITIKSTSQIKNLSLNEKWKVDLNDDKSSDILVTLLNISLDEKKALIKIKDISENIVLDSEPNKNKLVNDSTFEKSEEDKDVKKQDNSTNFIIFIILIILIITIVLFYIKKISNKRKSKSNHKRKKKF